MCVVGGHLECRTQGTERVGEPSQLLQGLGFRVWGVGFRVEGSEFRVSC
jgi:hypothetical protein